MGCDFPIKAYRSEERSPTGKRLIVFNPHHALNSQHWMEVPCNNCTGCKLENARQWAVRMTHESKLYDQSCFITLTYSDETVPQSYSLEPRALQLFNKKLRKSVDHKIRFFGCGEYGDELGRPHYHMILFNHDWPDKEPWKRINGKLHYTSEKLTKLWGNGHATTTDVTFDACSYCARYVTKKIKIGDDYGAGRYFKVSPIDGQYHMRHPEFARMSTKPGLGYNFFKQFQSDFYPHGFCVVNGVQQAIPKYYVSKLTEEEQQKLKRQSIRNALRFKTERTMERRRARAAVRDARISKLKRDLQ